jgi:hypothetical protein
MNNAIQFLSGLSDVTWLVVGLVVSGLLLIMAIVMIHRSMRRQQEWNEMLKAAAEAAIKADALRAARFNASHRGNSLDEWEVFIREGGVK